MIVLSQASESLKGGYDECYGRLLGTRVCDLLFIQCERLCVSGWSVVCVCVCVWGGGGG